MTSLIRRELLIGGTAMVAGALSGATRIRQPDYRDLTFYKSGCRVLIVRKGDSA